MGNDINRYRAAIGRFYAGLTAKALWSPWDIGLFFAFLNAKKVKHDARQDTEENDNINDNPKYNADDDMIDNVIRCTIDKEKQGK